MKKLIATIILSIGIVIISFAQMYNYSSQNLIGTPCSLPTQVTVQLNGISFFGFAPNDSVKYVVYFGDGVSDSAYFQIYSNWLDSIHCELQHDYYFIGNYQPVIKVVWPNFHTDTMSSGIINVTNGCTPISGHIYKDMNGNCTFDSLVDVPFPYMNINANANNPAGNTNFFTNNFGYYSGNLVTGLTYSLTPNFYQNYAADCGTGIVGPFTTNGNLVITDWPIYYTNAPDVSAWVHGGYFRPGLTPFIATTTFYGHTGISAQFQFTDSLELDPQVVYNSTINGNIPDGFNSDKVWWTNSTTICNTSQNNVSTLELSPLAQIGDIVHFKYRINPILNELDTLDNIDESVYVVGNSYDPNYIEPKPIEGIVDTGITIKYMIHFQNTGTDTAYNIFIIDTLDANLEFLSFEILGATHQLSIDYLAGNIIKFNFYNINLIDSGTDLALSQGFVAYKIKVKSNLAIGTQIKNTAFIYFDINPPVKTNTTIHHIGMIDAIVSVNNTNLTLYPNPASNVLNIKLNATQQQYSITDTKGNTLMQNSISKQEQLQIDISTLPSGFYIIGFLNKLGYITREKFVKL